MASPIKIGVIGVGKMGTLHLRKYLNMKDVEVVGVYETDPRRAAEIEQNFGVRNFSELSSLLFESDAVTISSPTSTHYRLGRLALEAGVDVLMEKPISDTAEEASHLVSLSRSSGRVFQVGFIERFRYQHLAKSYPLQPVRFLESHRLSVSLSREGTIDVVSDLMIHDVDLTLSLVGEEPSHVSAVGVPVLTPYYDLANVRLEFPSGAVANLNASRVAPRGQRKFRVFSLEAYASMDFTSNEVEVYRRNRLGEIEREAAGPFTIDALKEQCESFIDCVRHRKEPLVTAVDGLRALTVAEAIKQKIVERDARSAFFRPSSSPERPQVNE